MVSVYASAPYVLATIGGNVAETWKGDIHCLKCKKKFLIEAKVEVKENGRRSATGTCPQCGKTVNRFLPKA